MTEYRPGAVVNGWVLGRDLRWHPAQPGQSPDTPVAGLRVGPPATEVPFGSPAYDTRVPYGFDRRGGFDQLDGFDHRGAGGAHGRESAPRRRKGALIGAALTGLVGMLVGFALGESGGVVTAAEPTATVTVTLPPLQGIIAAPISTSTGPPSASKPPKPAATSTAKGLVSAPRPTTSPPRPASSSTRPKTTAPKTTAPKTTAPKVVSLYFANCAAARAAGAAPLSVGDPGYRPALDRDKDGLACE